MDDIEEKKHGRLEWFTYMILLPLLFTAILSGVLMAFLGYDIKGTLFSWGNKIPYVEKLVPGPNPHADAVKEEEVEKEETVELKQQLADMNQKLQEEQSKQAAIKQESVEKEEQVELLKQDVQALQNQLAAEKMAQEEAAAKAKRETASVYAQMSASKAAPILSEMPLDQALMILKELKTEERSAILAKMEPALAAEMTTELLKETERSP